MTLHGLAAVKMNEPPGSWVIFFELTNTTMMTCWKLRIVAFGFRLNKLMKLVCSLTGDFENGGLVAIVSREYKVRGFESFVK